MAEIKLTPEQYISYVDKSSNRVEVSLPKQYICLSYIDEVNVEDDDFVEQISGTIDSVTQIAQLTPQNFLSYIGEPDKAEISLPAPSVCISYVPEKANEIVEDFDTNRNVKKTVTADFEIETKTKNIVEVDFSIIREIETVGLRVVQLNNDIQRKVTQHIELGVDTKREIVNSTAETFDARREVRLTQSITFDLKREVLGAWRYENAGTADSLTLSGTTLTELPETQSKTGFAFYQTTRAKCFDIPATEEIWIKFDVYTTLAERWRAYNEISNTINGICEQTDGRLSIFVQGTAIESLNSVIKHQLQSVLLHMISGSTAGVVEVWLDGKKVYNYTGNVNNGEVFNDIYLQSDGAGTYFSNVIISNVEIGLDENVKPVGFRRNWQFDTERTIKNDTLDSRIAEATKVLLHFDKDENPYKDECENIWTAYGAPTISSDNAKFGKALQLINTQYIQLDNVELAGQDFTIEFWGYRASNPHNEAYFVQVRATKYALLDIGQAGSFSNYLTFWANAAANATSNMNAVSVDFKVPVNELHHIALVYRHAENNARVYVDGVCVRNETDLPSYIRQPFKIILGSQWADDHSYLAIDEFRIIDGLAIYDEDFTPPTTPYTVTRERYEDRLFDTTRKIVRSEIVQIDTIRDVNFADKRTFLNFDLCRNIKTSKIYDFDLARVIVHRLVGDTAIRENIQIELATQQLTDRLSYATIEEVEIMQQVKGQYLDYEFDMRVEETNKQGILTSCQCCSDIDELLYTPLTYEIEEDYVEYEIDIQSKTIKSRIDVGETETNTNIIRKARAGRHMQLISSALKKELVLQIDDFVSDMEIRQEHITYSDLISNLFGWTSRLPQLTINCYLRGDKIYVVQRGHESNVVNISNLKHTNATIHKKLMRTTWSGEPDSQYTLNIQHSGFYFLKPPPEVSEDGKTHYTYRNLGLGYGYYHSYTGEIKGEHGFLLTESHTYNDDGSEVITEYHYTHTKPYELTGETTTRIDKDGDTEISYVKHTYLTPSQRQSMWLDEDKNAEGSVVGSHIAGFYDEIETLSEPYTETDTAIIDGNPLIDTNFPIEGKEKFQELSEAIRWLNRKTQETISLDVYDCEHVIDFNDRIVFEGNEYYLESNTVIKTARIMNRQSLKFMRWY